MIKNRTFAALALAGLVSFAACGGAEEEGTEADIVTQDTLVTTDTAVATTEVQIDTSISTDTTAISADTAAH